MGLPIVESMQHGKMSIASNISSMLEIGDGMVDYFSPYDARSCMNKILHYTKDKTYEQMNIRIMREYKVYTWDKSHEKFRSVVASTDR